MAQLVAHLLCKQGVTGSSPVSSTHPQFDLPRTGDACVRVSTVRSKAPSSTADVNRLDRFDQHDSPDDAGDIASYSQDLLP